MPQKVQSIRANRSASGGGASISPRAGWSPLLGSAPMRILVTGGCGFIGSNFIRYILQHYKPAYITNVDALTYAGNLANLDGVVEEHGERYEFFQADIANADQMDTLLHEEQCYAIINFAAESHVDRSINSPQNFIHTNVVGTSVLLDAARRHGVQRFIQVSTDEVYGSLGEDREIHRAIANRAEFPLFREQSWRRPSRPRLPPYLWPGCHRDALLQQLRPYQFPEKLIPLMIIKALNDQSLPVYGDGKNVRDWIHVEDHCAALVAALFKGKPGQIYNLGGDGEMVNLDVVRLILDQLGKPHSLISFVTDRLGHDRRYAIDSSLAQRELDWHPLHAARKASPHRRLVSQPPRLVADAARAHRALRLAIFGQLIARSKTILRPGPDGNRTEAWKAHSLPNRLGTRQKGPPQKKYRPPHPKDMKGGCSPQNTSWI